MRCLSCNREIEGEPDWCPACGAVLDWPERPVPKPVGARRHRRRLVVALAALRRMRKKRN